MKLFDVGLKKMPRLILPIIKARPHPLRRQDHSRIKGGIVFAIKNTKKDLDPKCYQNMFSRDAA